MRSSLLFSALALFGGSAVAQTPAEVVTAFHHAVASGDTAQALAYLHADVIIFESGSAEMSREEFASGHLGADMSFAAATTREITDSRTILEGDLAVVMNRTKTSGTMGDREINSVGVETVALRRVGGEWKIVHIHWSSRRQR
jgi:ketosteroid isomerase-like protein